jgi:hypothetical protein
LNLPQTAARWHLSITDGSWRLVRHDNHRITVSGGKISAAGKGSATLAAPPAAEARHRRRRRRQDIGDGGGGKTSATAAEEEARVGRANWGEERRGRGRLQVVGGVLNRGEMACRRAIGFPERGPPLRPRARVQLPASRSGQLVPFVRL